MAIPKVFEMEFLKTGDFNVGDIFKIISEFKSEAPKFKSFLVGTVELADGEKRLLSLNKTSYRQIAEKLGNDTILWVTKYIKYDGQKKMGAMMGHSFVASVDNAGNSLPF